MLERIGVGFFQWGLRSHGRSMRFNIAEGGWGPHLSKCVCFRGGTECKIRVQVLQYFFRVRSQVRAFATARHKSTGPIFSLQPVSSSLAAMAPLRCPCDRRDLANLSDDQRERWARLEGRCWFWASDRLAYFLFCHQRYVAIWSDHIRSKPGNRFNRPSELALVRVLANPRQTRRFLVGDLYITESPPELLFDISCLLWKH